jgi:hypothetical protein
MIGETGVEDLPVTTTNFNSLICYVSISPKVTRAFFLSTPSTQHKPSELFADFVCFFA